MTFRHRLQSLAAAFMLLAVFAHGAATPASAQTVIRDDEIERNLRMFARPIFEQAGIGPNDVRFVIIDQNVMNAFVAGGMNMFLYTGLLLDTENVDELIGVIAHETGHIALGHLVRLRSEMERASIQALAASIIGIATAAAGGGDAGMAIMRGGQDMALRSLLSHTRGQESAADQSGVHYLERAGLPVEGFQSFMEKLAGEELLPASQQTEYIRTHPLSTDRVEFLERSVAESRTKGMKPPATWIEAHKRMISKLRGYLYPDQALRIKDTSIAGRYGAAIAYYRKHEVERALSLFDALIAEEPGNGHFLEAKAQMLMESGRVAESVPLYERAVTLLPDADLIRIAYGHALMESAKNDKAVLTKAIAQLRRAAQNENRNPTLHRLLATAYGRIGQEADAQLHLAEEALLQRRFDRAEQLGEDALKKFKTGSPGALRANDLLSAVERERARKKDK